ncbi:MAG: Lrp/AsnC family transcriptional regulator, leucine-responsive regulatory protein [Actinomycetota bacterium]|nr:Lrp/AsnC family transcriptional regulator, leucine-responsive regulatory protein [Actinomycetota bacterium]
MDDIDRRLLALLVDDARSSYADLARAVGLSAPSVHDRVRRLERLGALRGYRAVVDPVSVGMGVTALVGILQREGVEQDELAEGLARIEEVEDCWFVAGEEAFVVKVRVADVDALEQTLGALRRTTGVARTRTTVVLSTRFEGRSRLASGVQESGKGKASAQKRT